MYKYYFFVKKIIFDDGLNPVFEKIENTSILL